MGWVNANDTVKSVACFTIAPEYRRKGIAKVLLSRGCLYAKAGFGEHRKLGKETIMRKKP